MPIVNIMRSHRLGLALLVAIGGLLFGTLRLAHGSSPKALLPNLVADPPDNMILGAESESIQGISSGGPTQLLLRFNGYVHNIGPGALDIRGSRKEPKVSQKTTAEVEYDREHEESTLSQQTEEELASPPMKVFQRVFTTNEGNPEESEKYMERPHEERTSAGEMIYVNADGHHHWHLQKVAKYSLWNASRTAEVAPAQKVGFCLEDSQHVEPNVGPATPVYSDKEPPYRDFCQQYRPNATSVYEGISPGWRDVYNRELAFQWVNVSDVLPGEYWMREDVNPLGAIQEEPAPNEPAYATTPTIIPGYDASAQTLETQPDKSRSITLTSQAWQGEENGEQEEPLPSPVYSIVSGPAHGSLSAIAGNQITYTPQPGYTGSDSFSFTATDPESEFPTHPAIATVSIQVNSGATQPSLSIGGAPASMIAGTSVALAAVVANDDGGVEWSASAGSFTSEGPGGASNNYIAPSQVPAGGTVTVTAWLKDDHEISDQVTIAIAPVPTPTASPEVQAPLASTASTGSGKAATGSKTPAAVSQPRAMLIGHELVMSVYVTKPGHLRVSAYLGKRLLGACAAHTAAKRTFTCRVKLGPRVSLRAPISVLATLLTGHRLVQSRRPAARVAQMKMAAATALAAALGRGEGGSSAEEFWCDPTGGSLVSSTRSISDSRHER